MRTVLADNLGGNMTRMKGLLVFALLAFGCATNSAVKEQIDPLAKQISAIERKQADLDARLADVSKKQDAQAADLQGLHSQVAQTAAAAQNAQQAAADAQAAASRAETAADKSTKAFALGQKKGK